MTDELQHMEDELLWNLFLKGEIKALEMLYRRHYDLLLNYGYKIHSDREFVKDAIQDLFIKICQSKKLSETPCVRNYFLRAFRNIILDKLSSMRMMENIDDIEFNLLVEDSELEILFQNNDEDIQLSKKLLSAYHQLPEKQRLAIYLHYVRELPYKEIAPVLEMTPQSAMNMISKILTKLRKNLMLFNFFFFH